MTTTVTIKTHDWPAKVVATDVTDYKHGDTHVVGHQTTTQIVEPNSEQQFVITNTRSLAFEELPKPTED